MNHKLFVTAHWCNDGTAHSHIGCDIPGCYFDVDIGDNGHISVDELTALQEAHDTIGRIQDMAKEKSPLTQLMKPTNPPK